MNAGSKYSSGLNLAYDPPDLIDRLEATRFRGDGSGIGRAAFVAAGLTALLETLRRDARLVGLGLPLYEVSAP